MGVQRSLRIGNDIIESISGSRRVIAESDSIPRTRRQLRRRSSFTCRWKCSIGWSPGEIVLILTLSQGSKFQYEDIRVNHTERHAKPARILNFGRGPALWSGVLSRYR